MTHNRLGEETSPYLLDHKDNPVHWQPWDDDALGLARDQNKPILLSVGYSACHWCHVMAEESFEDAETAALMNRLFVNIKVDREERPDIDMIYQSALAELGQQRGWPLTMFLTPEAKPYGGGTYYPPTPGYGRPAFREVLQAMAEAHAKGDGKAADDAAKLVATLETKGKGGRGGQISVTQLNHVAAQLAEGVDPVYGGFGREAKFPHTMANEVIWRAYCRTGHASFKEAALLSAEQMCLGGLYDHLGGGFYRYAVDEFWLVPHFEKMLYDNALNIDLLVMLWQGTENPLFARRIESTADWLLREMRTKEGGFAASLAADSAGYGETDAGEGAFYVWSETEIDALLGADSTLFKTHYDVSTEGNWDGTNVLNRSAKPEGKNPETEARLNPLRSRLWTAREERPRPALDDKVLADWNGLAIAALARAGSVFGRGTWIDAAQEAFDFVRREMSDDRRLRHSFRAGQRGRAAILDDYANMARAALGLFEATGDWSLLAQAEDWVAVAEADYWDHDEGGFFVTSDTEGMAILRPKSAQETSTPSGNGVMVGVLARLHALTAKPAYRERAEATIAAFSPQLSAHFFALASLLNGSELLDGLVQIVIVGETGVAETERLAEAANTSSLPNRLLLRVPPGTEMGPGHPAAGKNLVKGKPAAYVCLGQTCHLPVTEPEALRAALQDCQGAPERA